jgi:hypothetical protein
MASSGGRPSRQIRGLGGGQRAPSLKELQQGRVIRGKRDTEGDVDMAKYSFAGNKFANLDPRHMVEQGLKRIHWVGRL